jgi:hypothetical protein
LPARVDREWFSERLFCDLACFAANFDRCVSADAKICGLLNDTICINALLLRRIDKIKSDNQLFLIWQDDVEGIPVVPTLGLIRATVDSLERLRGRGAVRARASR